MQVRDEHHASHQVEGWTTMAELQREGKVRYIGVSNFSVAQMERALKIGADHLSAAAVLHDQSLE